MNDPIITIDGLNKTYEGGFQALTRVDLTIQRGEIFALLGPNGAGKTTLISLVCGLVNPSEGHVIVDGFDSVRDYRQAGARIGLVPQELTNEAFETVWNTVSFSRGLFGKSPNPAHIEKVLKSLSLWDKRHNRLMTLSGGMKRRVLIAKALAHEPDLLFLDEPTAGVDVELRKGMWAVIDSMRERGVTIILTTHYLEEAEQLCDRIAIINHGELIADKPTRELVGMAREKIVAVTVDKDLTGPIEEPVFTKAEVIEPRRLEITYDRDKASAGQVLALVQSHGYAIEDVTTREADLEDVFVQLTGAG